MKKGGGEEETMIRCVDNFHIHQKLSVGMQPPCDSRLQGSAAW